MTHYWDWQKTLTIGKNDTVSDHKIIIGTDITEIAQSRSITIWNIGTYITGNDQRTTVTMWNYIKETDLIIIIITIGIDITEIDKKILKHIYNYFTKID